MTYKGIVSYKLAQSTLMYPPIVAKPFTDMEFTIKKSDAWIDYDSLENTTTVGIGVWKGRPFFSFQGRRPILENLISR